MFRIFLSITLFTFMASNFSALANQCQGQVYGINSQRGAQGVIFSLNEGIGEASAKSPAALFSSAAIAYNNQNKRLYYISAPRPLTYKIDTSALNLPSDAILPIQGAKYRYTKLAYYDIENSTHKEVGRTRSLISLAYDQNNDRLLGTSTSKLYEIDKNTGDTTELMSIANAQGKYRGDLVFHENRLILVTSSSVYHVDIDNRSLNKLSDHELSSVSGATTNINGDLIIGRVLQTDSGHSNSSKIYKLLPDTGKTCFISSVPVRLNDLAFADIGSTTCYSLSDCDALPSFDVQALTDTVIEGGTLTYRVSLNKAFAQDVSFSVAVEDVSTSPSDYTPPASSLVIAAGLKTADIEIVTNDNSVYTGDKTLKLKVTGVTNTTGIETLNGIIQDNESERPSFGLTPINDSVFEGQTLSYTVTLSKVYSEPVEFSVSVEDVTTQPGDYTAPASTLIIAANTLSSNISIPTNDNTDYTGDKTLTLKVVGTQNTTGTASLGGTIKENEVVFNCNGYNKITQRITSPRYGPGKMILHCDTGKVEYTLNRYNPNKWSGLAFLFHPSGRRDVRGQSYTFSQSEFQRLKSISYSGTHYVYPNGAGCRAGEANKHLSTTYFGSFTFDRSTNTMSCHIGMVSQYCTGGNADSRFETVEARQCSFE